MNQKELKNLINEIYGHATSIKEDMEYGLKAQQEIRVTDQEEKELTNHETQGKKYESLRQIP